MERYCRSIRTAIEEVYGVEWRMICSGCRGRIESECRYVACYILHFLCPSVPKYHLAQTLGFSRNHSTVLYGLKVCKDWLNTDREFRNRYARVMAMVNALLEENYCQDLNKCKREIPLL